MLKFCFSRQLTQLSFNLHSVVCKSSVSSIFKIFIVLLMFIPHARHPMGSMGPSTWFVYLVLKIFGMLRIRSVHAKLRGQLRSVYTTFWDYFFKFLPLHGLLSPFQFPGLAFMVFQTESQVVVCLFFLPGSDAHCNNYTYVPRASCLRFVKKTHKLHNRKRMLVLSCNTRAIKVHHNRLHSPVKED